MTSLDQVRLVRPDPIANPVDDLQTMKLKLLKHVFRIIAPYFWGYKHTDIWPIGNFVARVCGKRVFDTKCEDSRWIALPLPVYTSHFLYGGDYKRFNSDNIHPVMKTLARPGTVAIDVGASCGQEVVTLSRSVGPDGLVYCFEPSFSFNALLRTVALNRLTNVVCVKAGCGNQNGFMSGQEDQEYFIGANCSYAEQGSGVPVIRIDDFLAHVGETRPVSLIKIDTDGFEYEVIQGAMATVEKHDTKVIAEFESQFNYSGSQGAEVLKRYQGNGFALQKIQTSTRPLAPEEFNAYLEDMRVHENMIAHDIVLSLDRKKAS